MPFSGIHEFSQPDAQLEIAAVFMTVNFAKSLPGLARGEILVIWKTTTSIFPITSAATSPPLKAIAPPQKKAFSDYTVHIWEEDATGLQPRVYTTGV